mgnify:CR=1 FL=1
MVITVKQLVKRAMQQDTDAFLELMECNTQDMYKVAKAILKNEEDVADAMQETILVCFEKLDTLQHPKYFKTWLIRILINICNDIIRQNQRQYLMSDVYPEMADPNPVTSNLEFIELLNTLDEKYRLIVVLYYVEGFKISEISQLLGMSKNTVKTRLSRARKSLKKEYEEINLVKNNSIQKVSERI